MKEIHKKILVFVKHYMLEHDYPPTTRKRLMEFGVQWKLLRPWAMRGFPLLNGSQRNQKRIRYMTASHWSYI